MTTPFTLNITLANGIAKQQQEGLRWSPVVCRHAYSSLHPLAECLYLSLNEGLDLEQFICPLLSDPQVLQDGGLCDSSMATQHVSDGGGVTANLGEEGVYA